MNTARSFGDKRKEQSDTLKVDWEQVERNIKSLEKEIDEASLEITSLKEEQEKFGNKLDRLERRVSDIGGWLGNLKQLREEWLDHIKEFGKDAERDTTYKQLWLDGKINYVKVCVEEIQKSLKSLRGRKS